MSYPNSCKDTQGRLRCGAAVGIGADTLARVTALVEAGVDVITVDSAHGHSLGVINTVRQIKENIPRITSYRWKDCHSRSSKRFNRCWS